MFLLWFASRAAEDSVLGVWGLAGTFIVLIVLVIVTFVFRFKVRSKQDAMNQLLASTSLSPETYFLFLRSFAPSRRMRTRVRHLSWTEQALSGTWWTIERALSLALAKEGLLVAIGETKRTVGAAKFSQDSEEWRSFVLETARGARAIFLVPGDTPSTIWETKQVLSDPLLANKTFFVMPQESRGLLLRLFGLRPGKTERHWRKVSKCLENEGIDLLEFEHDGMIFQFGENEKRHPLHDVAPSHVEQLVHNSESEFWLRLKWYDYRFWRWLTIFPPGNFLPSVVIFWIVLVVFSTFPYKPYWIPAGSMKPTLLIGDYIVVSDFAYGYSTHSIPLISEQAGIRLFQANPKRGDVVVFRHPVNGRDFIKRLVGLPGDWIQMKDGVLHINDAPVGLVDDGTFDETYGPLGPQRMRPRCANDVVRQGGICQKERQIETLPNGSSYAILNIGNQALDNTGVYHVPEGHFFFMGDNCDNSSDSRIPQSAGGVGFVPFDNLAGRADRIMFSSAGRSMWFFWTWRSDRYFKRIP